eukprot:3588296-Pleurochrysis_carterae.AAC.1
MAHVVDTFALGFPPPTVSGADKTETHGLPDLEKGVGYDWTCGQVGRGRYPAQSAYGGGGFW